MSSLDTNTLRTRGHRRRAIAGLSALLLVATAKATLPDWLQHVVGASRFDNALYRLMQVPSAAVFYPRPPKEAQVELAKLPDDTADLYPLRARTDEAALDFASAESDWKQAVVKATDPIAAKLDLANFYTRQLRIPQAIATLREVAAAPSPAAERLTDPAQQRSWQTYLRILSVIADQSLPSSEADATYDAFVARYPAEPAVYARAFQFQLDEKNYARAEALIAQYKQRFPLDQVLPVRAQALLEYRRGNADRALAVYEQAFQPLWPASLVQSYFALLTETHHQRIFVADARNRMARHPDGPEALNALARTFYYDQQQGRLDAAQQEIDAFRIARESRGGDWAADDLYTLAMLAASIHSYAESARFQFALASMAGTLSNGEPAAQAGLSGLVDVLLTAPDQPIALGAGNLTLYRDIATLDRGPGYWNGILSLWLNGTSPESEYQNETAKSQNYFHRAKAAELLMQLDTRFPAAPERAALHAQLIRAYAQYGESPAVISAGKQYLAAFPKATARVEMEGLMADAFARQNDTVAEFALYDSVLAELAATTAGQPLSAATATRPADRNQLPPATPSALIRVSENDSEEVLPAPSAPAFSLDSYTTSRPVNPAADGYAQILDRYLGRLVATGKVPQALALLRHQMDQNPNDPALFERLATFLQQNNLSGAQEEVFKSAIARYGGTGWYDKLARFYLRQNRRDAFVTLTRQVTDIFSGTELDQYFTAVPASIASAANVQGPGSQLALQLNLYAQKRFPHDLVFTRNLLVAYQARPTKDVAAYDAELRQHWFEDPQLRDEFFAYLSRTGKLQGELSQLEAARVPQPASTRELAELDVWTSHFEQAAPLMTSVAALYPADSDIGDRGVSLSRSLSYLDTSNTSLRNAVAIETNLLAAAPDNPDRLATLGDLYAEATANGGEDLVTATPYWRRIPALHPGTPAGYLTSATIFWDYFQFNDALAELSAARTRFHQPALYGYEAGAIAENQRNLATAVNEYTASATQPAELEVRFKAFVATAQAYFKPPSDAADSNFRSTAQSFFNSENSRTRLLQLANRPSTKGLVDQASAQALRKSPTANATLMLRADVLTAQHRQPELIPLLTAAIQRAVTPEEAAAIGALAQGHTLPAVYEEALARQAVVSADPVEKIEVQYTLARSLEARKQIAEATRIIDTVYRANPRVLGVVRATTDYYARINQPRPAIATLLEAAKAATPVLSRSFTMEAAQRANDAGDTAQARTLALALLPADPYDAAVLSIIDTSYARTSDNAGLKAFYVAQLDRARTDPAIGPDARKQDIALLRRGLIPALTHLQDYPGAVEQYIALLSAFPEDSATAQEAALYCLRNNRQSQLVGFLQNTVRQSPKDSRFPILLAQVQTTFEDLPAAVSAYDLAVAIRKDRADLYSARVDLELRLGLSDPSRLEPAAADFSRLYLLTYKDPQWMVRLAELRARQQRNADAVKALSVAYIDGRPKLPSNYFMAASQLEKWNLLTEARAFAQQGLDLAGNTLFTSPGPAAGAATYARILTRLGEPEAALGTLRAIHQASNAAITFPAELTAELLADGTPAASIATQRTDYLSERRRTSQARFNEVLTTIGTTVRTYYTPEQKVAYGLTLDTLHATDANMAIVAATSAGLADREALWRRQRLQTGGLNDDNRQNLAAYSALQQRRLQFRELAQTLEAYAARLAPQRRVEFQRQAANAWRSAGDEINELRVTRALVLANDTGPRDRFFDLLLRRDASGLTTVAAGSNESLADAAVNYTVAHTDLQHATSAVEARSRRISPLWRDANLALTGLYFAPHTPAGEPALVAPAIQAAFVKVLRAGDPIGERIAHPADPATTLTGDLWFYFGGRFGSALGPNVQGNGEAEGYSAEDYLPAVLERAPLVPEPYIALAHAYDDANNAAAAVIAYRHALELAPNSITVNDSLATLLYRANRNEGIAQWRNAFAILRRRVETNSFPDEFYTGFQSVLLHLGQRHLTGQFHPEIEAVVRPYFAKNGNYRSNEFLQAVYNNSASPAEGASFILSLATSASDPELVLADLHSAAWLTPEATEAILLRRLTLAQSASPDGDSGSANDVRLRGVRQALLQLYFEQSQDAKAQALLDSIPSATRAQAAYDNPGESAAVEDIPPTFGQARVLLAARGGRLQALLANYRANSDQAPGIEVLVNAADTLARPIPRHGSTPARLADPANARLLREYIFEQKQVAHTLIPTDFLALAQSRIDTGDLPGALELLRRLALQPASASVTFAAGAAYDVDPATPPDANPYANIDSAARLLESAHHLSEALPFLAILVQSVPWDAGYRVRLGEAQVSIVSEKARGVTNLSLVAQDRAAPYDARVRAAQDLASAPSKVSSGSAELDSLASGGVSRVGLTPYADEARLAASAATSLSSETRGILLREVIAIAPESSAADKARIRLLLDSNDGPPAVVMSLIDPGTASAQNGGSDNAEADTTSDRSANAASDEAETDDSASAGRAVSLPSAAASLDLGSRVRLATIIASAYERDHERDAASSYLNLAVDLDQQNAHPDPALVRRRDDLKASIHLERLNDKRRPILRKDLDQPADVRPRLTLAGLARMETP